MRLHSIRLVDYRGITDATVEFGPGVTIVEGPNEIGKSSIHQAITQLREDKASSRKASVKDTQPVGSDVGPQVELHLSTGDFELRYGKRWLKQPFTELNILRPVPEQLSGDEAHERFLSILDETVDVDLLDALDVAQGRSLAQASLAEIKALHGALSESGEAPADHDAFLDRIESEYLRFFTAKGKETGDLRRLTEELPAAEEQYTALVARSEDMDALVDRHARAAERLQTVREQLGQAMNERDEAQEAAQELSGLKAELERAQEAAETGRREEQRTEEAWNRRRELIAEAAAAEKTVQATAADRDKLADREHEQDAEFGRAQKALEDKQAELDTARTAAKSASANLARARARREVRDLRKRLTSVREQERRAAEAKATIGAIAVTAKDVEHLSGLVTEVRIATKAKTAAAAQIIARRLGDTDVSIDGVQLAADDREEFAVVKDTRILIDSVVDITVRPGQSPAELDRAVDEAESELDSELERLGVTSLDQARERADVRTSAEAILAEATSTLRALIGNDDRAGLDAALSRAEHLADESGESNRNGTQPGAGDTDEAGSDVDLDVDSEDDSDVGSEVSSEVSSTMIEELEAAVEETAAAVETAQDAVESARLTLDSARNGRDETRVASVRSQAQHEQSTMTLENLTARLAADREAQSDEELESALAGAQERTETLAADATAARERYAAADPETLEMRLQNALQLVDSKQRQQEADRQEVDRLSALIDDRAGEGIYDKLKAAQEALETLQTKLARLRRQANAISLLRETVRTHKEEAQRKYVAPFKEQIERLGRVIFGQGLSVEISEDLEIVSRTLDGRTVGFESLSGGTKEQLALLGRLAVATLVDETSGAPVILDDAFGFADEKRLAALNVILGNVGRNAQVILLTCQPGRFGAIGGAETVSLA